MLFQIVEMDIESIENEIFQVLPNLDRTVCANLSKFLNESGLESEKDLALVQENDLYSFVPFLMARKLIQAWERFKGSLNMFS